MFVLGIDPGLSRCGYCVLRQDGRTSRAVALGVITTPPEAELPARLLELQTEVRSLLREFSPEVLAVERVLFQVNARTAMSVGQASGIAMAEAAAHGCEVVQYSPNQVKQVVTGWGGADKEQVQRMVQSLLDLPAPPKPADAADAAALALCHVAMAPMRRAVARSGGQGPSGPESASETWSDGNVGSDASSRRRQSGGQGPSGPESASETWSDGNVGSDASSRRRQSGVSS